MEINQAKPKVLIVDDEESIRMSARYSLENWFNITESATTAKALELLEEEHFDLVLLDIVIKNESAEAGLDALKIINKKYPNLPVIMLSGSLSWMQRWGELKQFGAFGYLSKPFDRGTAKRIMERCLMGERLENVGE